MLAVTDPAEGTFTIAVNKHEDPYRIKIEYDSTPQEPCSLLTMKIAVKPQASLPTENLSCATLHKLPPLKVLIGNEIGEFELSHKYQMSDEFMLSNFAIEGMMNHLYYDMQI